MLFHNMLFSLSNYHKHISESINVFNVCIEVCLMAVPCIELSTPWLLDTYFGSNVSLL